MNENQLLDTVITIGRRLIQCGAEIYRAEESIKRICAAYGYKNAEMFAIPAGIIVTIIKSDGEPLTRTCRVGKRETNLDRVDKYNSLSRFICSAKPDYDTIKRKMSLIESRKVYSIPAEIISYAVAGMAFALSFGGGVPEAAAAAAACVLIFFIRSFLNKLNSSVFLRSVVCSMIASFFALSLDYLGIINGFDKVIISALMTLVPGVAITNCMRDFIAGDLVAGLYTLTEAVLTATGIAVGAGTVVAAAIHG